MKGIGTFVIGCLNCLSRCGSDEHGGAELCRKLMCKPLNTVHIFSPFGIALEISNSAVIASSSFHIQLLNPSNRLEDDQHRDLWCMVRIQM